MLNVLRCQLTYYYISLIRDKLWPMPKHGAINLYVQRNQKAHEDGQPRTSTSTLTQLLNYEWCRARALALESQLSMIERGQQMDGWPLCATARLCTHPEISTESNSVHTPHKSFGWDYRPKSAVPCPVCIHTSAKRSHVCQKDPVLL